MASDALQGVDFRALGATPRVLNTALAPLSVEFAAQKALSERPPLFLLQRLETGSTSSTRLSVVADALHVVVTASVL